MYSYVLFALCRCILPDDPLVQSALENQKNFLSTYHKVEAARLSRADKVLQEHAAKRPRRISEMKEWQGHQDRYVKSRQDILDRLSAIQKKIGDLEAGKVEAESYDFRCAFPGLFPGALQTGAYVDTWVMPYLPRRGDLFRVRKGNLIYEGDDQVILVGIENTKPLQVIRLPATIRGVDTRAAQIGAELDETGLFIVVDMDGRQPVLEKVIGSD